MGKSRPKYGYLPERKFTRFINNYFSKRAWIRRISKNINKSKKYGVG